MEEEGFKSESFLRLHVGEEYNSNLFPNDFTDIITARMKGALLDGIVVNGIRYRFLAYSSSQLKECSIWMVSPEKGWTVEGMRESMGNFDKCNTPSKYAARMGQCFSTTFQGLAGQDTLLDERSRSSPIRHTIVKDIISSDNFVHSDGCGLISKHAMSKLLEMLPHSSRDKIQDSSIVQIRYGGAKGVLVVWDDSVLQEIVGVECSSYDVILRNSMVKFDAPFKYLEVCTYVLS